MSIENTEIGQNKTDYQGLVTKWREQVRVLHRNADNSSYEYGRAIFREQAQRIEKCADELAEVIARNVQPSPDAETLQFMNETKLANIEAARPNFEDDPAGFVQAARERKKSRDAAEARPVQQPATEPK